MRPSYFVSLVILLLAACRTSRELNLDEPLLREQAVEKVLSGTKYNVGKEDISQIHALMQDARDSYRLAGLILALEIGDEAFYPDIVRAGLDENPEISKLALEKIRSMWAEFEPLLMSLLRDSSPSVRSSGLSLLGELGGDDKIQIIIDFFADVDADVRNQASLSIWKIADRENTLLRKALLSANELVAATAYRTLGHFSDMDDIETLIAGLSSQTTRIRREAQLAILRFGEDALPNLHAIAGDRRMSYRVRLSALEVIGGLRSTLSSPLLIELLDDEDNRIVIKAQTILGTYDSEIVPELARFYSDSTEKNRIKAIYLMGEIGAPSALPFLADALGDKSELVSQAAIESLDLYSREAWPAVRDQLSTDDSLGVETALDYLMSRSDPWLAKGDDGEVNTDVLYLMLTRKSREELEFFLNSSGITRLNKEMILSLKDVWNLGPNFTELESLSMRGNDKYLYNWRQRELLLASSRKALKDSFDALRDYFDSDDQSALRRSKELREQSRDLENKARVHEKAITGMREEEKIGGVERQIRYEEIRDFLVRTWEFVVPRMRALAILIYEGRGLDAQALVREASLPDFGSDGDRTRDLRLDRPAR